MDLFFHEIYLPRKSASQPPLNSISTVTNVSPVFSSRVSFSSQNLSFQHRASIFSPIEFHFFFGRCALSSIFNESLANKATLHFASPFSIDLIRFCIVLRVKWTRSYLSAFNIGRLKRKIFNKIFE